MNTHPLADFAGTVTQVLDRKDGSQVKIVAKEMYGAGLHRSVGVSVFRRASPEQAWEYLSDRPAPNWREMSVDDYVKHGRPPMLQAVTHGEIFRVVGMLGKPMSSFEQVANA